MIIKKSCQKKIKEKLRKNWQKPKRNLYISYKFIVKIIKGKETIQ